MTVAIVLYAVEFFVADKIKMDNLRLSGWHENYE